MYCKTCGTKNSAFAQFCVNDGAQLAKETEPVSSQYTYAGFCSKCGGKMSAHAQFCTDCGQGASSISVSSKKGIHLKIPQSFSSVTSSTQRLTDQAVGKAKKWFSAAEWKRILIGGGVMALTWLVIVFVLFLSAKNALEKAFRSNFSLEEWLDLSRFFDSFGFFQYASLLAARSLTGDISISDEYGEIETIFSGTITAGSITTLLLLFIAALAGSFAVLYKNNTRNWSWPQFIQVSALFGLAYSIGTTLVLLIGGGDITTVTELAQFSAALSFSPFSALFYNFIFAFMISFVAMALVAGAYKSSHLLRSTLYGDAIIRGAGSFFIGFVISTIAAAVFLYSSADAELKAEKVPGTSIYLMEAASVFYPLYHFSVLHGEGFSGEDAGLFSASEQSVSLGLFSEETIIEKMMMEEPSSGMGLSLFDSPLVSNWANIYFLILVPAALFFFNGRAIAGHSNQLPVKAALVFSSAYTLLVLLFAYWKKISVEAEADYESFVAHISSPLITTGIATFLFSFALLLLGAYAKQWARGRAH